MALSSSSALADDDPNPRKEKTPQPRLLCFFGRKDALALAAADAASSSLSRSLASSDRRGLGYISAYVWYSASSSDRTSIVPVEDDTSGLPSSGDVTTSRSDSDVKA